MVVRSDLTVISMKVTESSVASFLGMMFTVILDNYRFYPTSGLVSEGSNLVLGQLSLKVFRSAGLDTQAVHILSLAGRYCWVLMGILP